MVEVELIRPLDGKAEGATAEYPENDAKRLEKRGLLKIIGPAKQAPEPENKMEPVPENKASDIVAPGKRAARKPPAA